MKDSSWEPQKWICRLQEPWIEEKEKAKKGEQMVWKADKWEEEEIFAGTELAHQSQHDAVRKGKSAHRLSFDMKWQWWACVREDFQE